MKSSFDKKEEASEYDSEVIEKFDKTLHLSGKETVDYRFATTALPMSQL